MKLPLRRAVAKIFDTILLAIFTSVSTLGPCNPLSVSSAHAAPLADYAVRNPWPDLTHYRILREDKTYELYRVVANGNQLGLYAVDQATSARVQDRELELSLIFEAATLDKWYNQPSQILLPKTGYAVVPGAEYTTTYRRTFTWPGPPPGDGGALQDRCTPGTFNTDIANFIAYDNGGLLDDPTEMRILGFPQYYNGAVDSWWFGLTCSDELAQMYGQVIVKSVLQEINSPEAQQAYLERAGELLTETRDNTGNALSGLGILADVGDGLLQTHVEEAHQYVLTAPTLQAVLDASHREALLRGTKTLNKAAGAGLGILSAALAYKEHEKQLSTRALLIIVQREYLLADGQARLDLLKKYITNHPDNFSPAAQKGIDYAIEAFDLIQNKDRDARKVALTDPTMVLSSAGLAMEVGSAILGVASLIKWLGIATAVGTITLPVGIAVLVITAVVIPRITDDIEYNKLVREMSVAYTFSTELADSLPAPGSSYIQAGSVSNVRDLMSLINIAWYSRLLYYHFIGDYRPFIDSANWHGLLPDNTGSNWPFNKPDGTQTRLSVSTEAAAGFNTTYNMVKTTNDGFYLNMSERQNFQAQQLTAGAENNFSLGTGQLPLEGQAFTKGSLVPLRLQAESTAGVKFVEFFVYLFGTSAGSAYCTDTNGPDAQGYWTCPSGSGWDTFSYAPGRYTIEARVTNTFDRSFSHTVNVVLQQINDQVQVTLTLTPASVTVGAGFTASGTVRVNGAVPSNATVLVEIVGEGTNVNVPADSSTGNYSTSALHAPNRAANFVVKATAATAAGAGYTTQTLSVAASPVAGSNIGIRDFAVEGHVEPGDQVRFSSWVYNAGTVSMTARLIYELKNPSGTVVSSYQSDLFTLASHGMYPASGDNEIQYLATTSTAGTYTGVAKLVTNTGAPISDETLGDNNLTLGVSVSASADPDQYEVLNLDVDTGETISAFGNYTITLQQTAHTSPARAKLDIAYNHTSIAGGGTWYTDGDEIYLTAVNTKDTFMYLYDVTIRSSYIDTAWIAFGRATSLNWEVHPSNPLKAKRGSRATLTVVGPATPINLALTWGPDVETVRPWVWDQTYMNPARTIKKLELDIPLDAALKTYTFFLSMDNGTGAVYLQKVKIQVIEADDVGVSSFNTGGSSSYYLGDQVPINATVQNYQSYTENNFPVNLTVTGPNGFALGDSRFVSLNGSANQPVAFTWDTLGLEPGTYTVNVATALPGDPYTGNDSPGAQAIQLSARPQLGVTASTNQSSYKQKETILVSAAVKDPTLNPIPGATVYAQLSGPSINETYPMVYNSTAQQYQLSLAYQNIGTYQVGISAIKEGYLSGQTSSPSQFTVSNAPPETQITSATVAQGAWSRSKSATFYWSGSDLTTAASSLLYSYHLDGANWSANSSVLSTTLSGLAEGAHTFYVRAYDGTDPDLTPAQLSFQVDTVAPTFDVAPSGNPGQVAAGSNLVITFDTSEAVSPTINLSSIDSNPGGNITVQEINSTTHVYQVSYVLSQNNTRADGTYVLPIFIQDAAGNSTLYSNLEVRLEDKSPQVISFEPAWETSVPVTSSVRIVFSEPMNASNTQSAFSITPSASGQFAWPDSQTLVFTPTVNLQYDSTYTVTVGSGARDLANKSLTPTTWSFSTVAGGPVITHARVASAIENTPIPITATITSSNPPVTPTLKYRIAGGTTYTSTSMVPIATNVYSATIPAATVTGAGVEYYISAQDTRGTRTSPASGNYSIAVTTRPGTFGKQLPSNGGSVDPAGATVSWTASTGATGYKVCVDASNNNTCDNLPWKDTAGTTFAVSGLGLSFVNGSTYYWQVKAVNAAGEREADSGTWWSFVVHTTVGAPSNLTATGNSMSQITLTWQDNSSDESDFHIERSPDGSTNWQEVGTSPSGTNNLVNGSLTCGTTYYYRVRAHRHSDSQYSSYATTASAITYPCTFGKTSPANALTNQPLAPALTWASTTGATSYDVCIDTTNNNACDPGWTDRGTNLSYTPPILAPTTTYYWQARARNASGATEADSGAWWRFTTTDAPPCFALGRMHTGLGGDPTATPPNSPNCPANQYLSGEPITLLASPAGGYTVSSWSGTTNNNSTSTVNWTVMPTAPLTVTVNYVSAPPTCYTLTTSHSGSGDNPAIAPSNSPSCPAGTFAADTTITLTAAPSPGYRVVGWSGTANNASKTLTNTVTMPALNQTASVNYGPVYALPFSDNFSDDKGWANESMGDFNRDATNQWLAWHISRSRDEKYYMPIAPYSGNFRVETRFKFTSCQNNNNLWFGLTKNLTDGIGNGVVPSGLFIDIGCYGGFSPNQFIRADGIYNNQSWYLSDNRLTYSNNVWYRIVMDVVGTGWTLTLYNDGGTQVGQTTGTFPAVHDAYNFIEIWSPNNGDWPQGDGLLDDLIVTPLYAQGTKPLPFVDDFSMDKGWTNPLDGYFSRDITNQLLNWHLYRSADERYYVPIDPTTGNVRFEARVKATHWANNCELYFGLAESLTGAYGLPSTWAPGMYTSFGWFGEVGDMIRPVINYPDRPDYVGWTPSDQSTWIPYSMNTWYHIVMETSGSTWIITAYDESENQVGRITGTLPVTGRTYNYFIIWNPLDGDWPTGDGLLDDVSVMRLGNNQPTLTAINPSSAARSGTGFTLTLTGTNFINGSTVRWNDAIRTTTFVSSTLLTANIPAADLTTGGNVSVLVRNPAPSGFQSNALTFSIGKANTTTTLKANTPSPSAYGQPVMLSAQVTATLGVPTGSITFKEGTTTLATASVDGTGTAAALVSTLAVGQHPIQAVYSGDVSYNASNSTATFTQTVAKADTLSTITGLAPGTSVFGQPVVVTTTVTAVTPGAGIPGGTVTIKQGATTMGTATLSASGVATATVRSTATGTFTVTAVYAGDDRFMSSTSAGVGQTVGKASTAVAVSPSTSSPVFGQNVTFTATVAVQAPGEGTPTGTVTFKDGATTLGTGALNGSGQATYITNTLTIAGSPHTISAVYGGDTNYNGNSGSSSVTVGKSNTATSLSASASSIPFGQNVTFTATLSATLPGSGTPTGNVQFKLDGANLGTAVNLVSGKAITSTSTLPVGAHTISAVYNGDTNYITSTCSTPVTVTKPVPTLTVAASPNPSILGQTVNFTVTVSSGFGTPTGSVTLKDGGTTLETQALGSGKAIFGITSLTAGTHTITAEYGGDSTFDLASGMLAGGQQVNNPVPILTSISPDSGAAGGLGFTLQVTGTNFVSGATVQWNGTALPTTFVSSTRLTATVSNVQIVLPRTAYVSVVNPTPGGGTSNLRAFWNTQTGALVSRSDIATNATPGGTATATTGGSNGVTVTAQGTGTVSVAHFGSNPGSSTIFGNTGAFVDVHVAPGSAFTSLTIVDCDLIGGNAVYWWNGSTWAIATNQTYNSTTHCVTITVNNSTSPRLADLTGTPFVPSTDSLPPTTGASATTGGNAYTFGTWTRQDVTVTLTAADDPGGSGVKQITYSATGGQTIPSTTVPVSTTSFTISGEGITTISYYATDFASNDETPKTALVRVDKSGPIITITIPLNGGTYTLNQVVAADYSCSDTGSGVATCTGPVSHGAAIDTSSVGVKTFTVTATDNLGNTSSRTNTYTVTATPVIHNFLPFIKK